MNNNNDMKNLEQFEKEGQFMAAVTAVVNGENVNDAVLNYVIGETIARGKEEKASEEKFMSKTVTTEGEAT